MRRVLTVAALAIVAGFVTLALSLAAARARQAHIYRANVGKTAFNATSGVAIERLSMWRKSTAFGCTRSIARVASSTRPLITSL